MAPPLDALATKVNIPQARVSSVHWLPEDAARLAPDPGGAVDPPLLPGALAPAARHPAGLPLPRTHRGGPQRARAREAGDLTKIIQLIGTRYGPSHLGKPSNKNGWKSP